MLNKKNYILIIILLVLAGLAYLYTGPIQNWKDRKNNEDSRNFLAHVSMEQVDKIEVVDKEKKLHVIIKEGGVWWAEPSKWPTEEIIISALEEKLSDIINAEELQVASLNPNNKVNFQTDDAQGLKVRLFQSETEVGNFIIGKVASDYQSTFISRENDDKTYRVPGTLVRAFDVTSWKDRTITQLGAVDTVVLKYPTQEIELTNIPDSRGEEYWRSIRPYTVRLNKEKAETFITALVKLEAISIPSQSTEDTGLDKPSLKIQVKGQGTDETILIGNKNKTGEYFTKKENDNKIFLISKDTRDKLVKQIVDLR